MTRLFPLRVWSAIFAVAALLIVVLPLLHLALPAGHPLHAFGMYLMRQIGRDGVYKSDLPDFMVFLDWKELPWYWSSPRR